MSKGCILQWNGLHRCEFRQFLLYKHNRNLILLTKGVQRHPDLSRRKIVTLTDGNATIEVKLWGRKLMPVYKRDLVFPYHVSMLMSTKGKRV